MAKKASKSAGVDFYDVKTRQKVSVAEGNVKKKKFVTKNGQTRYGLRGTTEDGRVLTKFISQKDWEGSSYAEEK